MTDEMTLRDKLAHALNGVSAENGSNTPDFILAGFLTGCLTAFDIGVKARERWYGCEYQPGGVRILSAPIESAPAAPQVAEKLPEHIDNDVRLARLWTGEGSALVNRLADAIERGPCGYCSQAESAVERAEKERDSAREAERGRRAEIDGFCESLAALCGRFGIEADPMNAGHVEMLMAINEAIDKQAPTPAAPCVNHAELVSKIYRATRAHREQNDADVDPYDLLDRAASALSVSLAATKAEEKPVLAYAVKRPVGPLFLSHTQTDAECVATYHGVRVIDLVAKS